MVIIIFIIIIITISIIIIIIIITIIIVMRCVADMYCIYWYDTNSLEEYTQTWTAVRNQGIILRIGYASSMTQWNHGLLPHICAFVGLTASTITVFCGTFRKSSRAVGPSAWDWWTPGDQQKITQRVNASLPQHACDNGRKCWKKLISAGCHMTFGHIHSWTINSFPVQHCQCFYDYLYLGMHSFVVKL